MTDIEKLKTRRGEIRLQLQKIDKRIVQAEREERERESHEMLQLLQKRGITSAQLLQLLQPQPQPQSKTETEEK